MSSGREDDGDDVSESQDPSKRGDGEHAAARFQRAVSLVKTLPDATNAAPGGVGSIQLHNDEKLKMYGLYKQATEGDVKASRPAFYDYVARAKWDAWNYRKGMSSADAKNAYTDSFVEFLKRYEEHPHAKTCLQSILELGHRWSEDVPAELAHSAESLAAPHSPLSVATDNDAYLSSEEYNVALAAREAAEEAERASSVSEAGGAAYMTPASFRPEASDGPSPSKGISAAAAPAPPRRAYPYAPARTPGYYGATAADVYPADSGYQLPGQIPYAVSHAQPEQPNSVQYQAATASDSVILPPSASRSSLGPPTRKLDGLLTKEAETALQALQTEVKALKERMEMMKREFDLRETKKKRGTSAFLWLLKLVIRHALVNSALLLVVLAYFYYRRSPIALGIVAEMTPRVLRTYKRGRKAVTHTGRDVVDCGRDVVANVAGKLHEKMGGMRG